MVFAVPQCLKSYFQVTITIQIFYVSISPVKIYSKKLNVIIIEKYAENNPKCPALELAHD